MKIKAKKIPFLPICLIGIACISLIANQCRAAVTPPPLIWTSPSKNEHGSMPIGNGDLAANVWVEPNGDLVFYISKSDAWSGNGRLLKLGRVRIKTEPALFTNGTAFAQELDLTNGVIKIAAGDKTVVFRVDANHPLISVNISSKTPFKAEAELEVWRNSKRQLNGQEMHSARGLMPRGKESSPKVFVYPDTVLSPIDNSLIWFHRNNQSCYPETLKAQHLESLLKKYPDPLINRTFGGLIYGSKMKAIDSKTLVSTAPSKNISISLYALTEQSPTSDEWVSDIRKLRSKIEKLSSAAMENAHKSWWNAFWQRSYIEVSGSPDASIVSRAYRLQRWVEACAGRGSYPIKFNGSLFTVAASDRGGHFDADYRRWGGCYWWQNTRLPYWAMLKAGDFDLMQQLWNMYRNALPLMLDRTQLYFKHPGIFCPETMYFWGTYANNDFGWHNKGLYTINSYIKYYWDSGIELSMMMLDYYAYTEDSNFVKTTLLPIADNVIKFYLNHYPVVNGKLHIAPAMSLETWHKAEDPLPVIVGLHTVLTRLMNLSPQLTTAEQRERWRKNISVLPPTPITTDKNGKTRLLPAVKFSQSKNTENPELYAVFPYRNYTAYKPDPEIALETWRKRRFKRTGGWVQDSIQAALLGLTGEAKRYVVSNAKKHDKGSRFPAFWGPNFDWTPDQDHGSVTMIALQTMLMQCDGNKIYLLPAWPTDWNVRFKLHAPYRTTVEGTVRDGKLVELTVTPKKRLSDVTIPEGRNGLPEHH